MGNFITRLKLIINDSLLRKKIVFVFLALLVFRFMANIPIPAAAGASLENLLGSNQALGIFNILSGGGLTAISIVMLGVGPYITASIIMQLLTMMSPNLKALYHEEGEVGKKKFMQISRLLTVPLALLQGFGLLKFLEVQGVLGDISFITLVLNVIIVTGGSVLLMWIGELISEFGIGNGLSLIIFAGIVSGLPSTLGQLIFKFNVESIPVYAGFLLTTVLIVAGIVMITEAERPIPITYAKQVRGQKSRGGVSTYLPIRLNQAGVIPIIFALSLLIFPQVVVNFLAQASSVSVQNFATKASEILSNQLITSVVYFILVFLFTFFYTAVTFDPDEIATNLQKGGAFIPGVRPGQPTSEYIAKILTRVTFVGALFLGTVAVLPFAMIAITGEQALALGGTALLIVVSVVLDLLKKIDAQLTMREY